MIAVLNATAREADIERLSAVLRSAFPGKRLLVEFEEYKRDRTSPQNRYLHGVAYKLLSNATGYELEDIAEYLCGTYFGWKDKKKPGKKVVQVPLRTTTKREDGKRSVLTTQEFEDYVAFVQRFGAQHGIYIPSPNEVT